MDDFIVGIAIKHDKARKHINEKLIDRASGVDIAIRIIDDRRPLEKQGPFDVILQKIRRKGTSI